MNSGDEILTEGEGEKDEGDGHHPHRILLEEDAPLALKRGPVRGAKVLVTG